MQPFDSVIHCLPRAVPFIPVTYSFWNWKPVSPLLLPYVPSLHLLPSGNLLRWSFTEGVMPVNKRNLWTESALCKYLTLGFTAQRTAWTSDDTVSMFAALITRQYYYRKFYCSKDVPACSSFIMFFKQFFLTMADDFRCVLSSDSTCSHAQLSHSFGAWSACHLYMAGKSKTPVSFDKSSTDFFFFLNSGYAK